MFCRIKSARNKIACVTPPDLTPKQIFDKTPLFTALNVLPPDDLLRCQLVSQGNITLRDAYLAFLHQSDFNLAKATVALHSRRYRS